LSKLSIQFRKFGLIPPLTTECALSLCPPSSFGLRWIHAFESTLELLEAALLGKFGGSFQPLN
jgi:hypothetical protein